MSSIVKVDDGEIVGALERIEKKDSALASHIREMIRVGAHYMRVVSVQQIADGNVIMTLIDRAGIEYQQTLVAGRSIDPNTGNYRE